jgi:hypothetical protein
MFGAAGELGRAMAEGGLRSPCSEPIDVNCEFEAPPGEWSARRMSPFAARRVRRADVRFPEVPCRPASEPPVPGEGIVGAAHIKGNYRDRCSIQASPRARLARRDRKSGGELAAVQGAVDSKFRNSSQTCVCANRILVQDAVYDVFAARLAARVKAFVLGPGLDGPTDQGPLIDEAAIAKVEAHVADACAKGARVVTGGGRHPGCKAFYLPTVLTEVTADMLLAREETFGPVAPLFRFTTDEEALRLANDTEFGLAAYVYTQDVGRVFRVAERLECGIVSVNTGLASTPVAPFGGIKVSGFGREGSKYGIEDFLVTKYLCLGGI